MPEGVPFKVTTDKSVRNNGATVLHGFNQPIILVSDLFNAAERRSAARHELNEWQLSTGRFSKRAHDTAEKRENPRLRRTTREKIGRYASMSHIHLRKYVPPWKKVRVAVHKPKKGSVFI